MTSVPGAATDAQHTTEYSTFEGLFVRALKVDAAFKAELKTIAVDLDRPVPRYPTRVWRAALELARKRYYPDLSVADARRQMGRVALQGFLGTISGRFLNVVLSLMVSPAAFVLRLPRFFTMTRTGVEMTVNKESEQQWRLVARDIFGDPDFVAGIIEGPGKKTCATFTIEIQNVTPAGYELVFRW
jgi:uncharacterized protein (TIGR02265 family)